MKTIEHNSAVDQYFKDVNRLKKHFRYNKSQWFSKVWKRRGITIVQGSQRYINLKKGEQNV